MKIVVDTNIVISAMLKANSPISDVLLSPQFDIELFSPYELFLEIFKHKEKIQKYSKLSETELLEAVRIMLSNISFVSVKTIDPANAIKAKELTQGIDIKDWTFVALTLQTQGLLWTSDLKLFNHLEKNGFTNLISTKDVIQKFL